MGPYRFFFSYSWKNLGPPLRRFFEALASYVRERVGGELADIAFRDRVTMQAGAEWPAGLFEALETSQVLVYLFSVDYLQSDYCGKELQAFLSRIRQFEGDHPGEPSPLFIQPVIWVPTVTETKLPRVIAARQPEDDAFPEEYKKKGLQSLATQRDKTAYKQCVQIIGDRIIKASNGNRLPKLIEYRSLEEIPNAFIEEQPRGGLQSTQATGPTEVKCIYVAGSAEEVEKLPERNLAEDRSKCYGAAGWYWHPFKEPITVGSLVQQMLVEYRHDEVRFGENIEGIIDELRRAAENDQIVLLVVDAWSAFLEQYREFLSKFDTSVLWNNAVIVPWNECDEPTNANRAKLEAQLRLLFRSKFVGSQLATPLFRSPIRNIDEFRAVLLSVLELIRSDIEVRRAAQLQLQGQPIAQLRTSRDHPNGR